MDPRAVHWAEALAVAALAELVLSGRLSLDERGGGRLTVLPGDAPSDPVLSGVLDRVRRFKKVATLAYWTDRLCRATTLRVATAEGLVRRGVLSIRRRGGIPFFGAKELPARDGGPEAALRADLTKAPLRAAPGARDSARLALVVVGDLLDDVFAVVPNPEALRRIRRTIRAHPIGRAIVDAVTALHEARAASKTAHTRAVAANIRMALLFGAMSHQGAGFGRWVEWSKLSERATDRKTRT